MYIPGIDAVRPVLEFLGTPFVALIIAVLLAMYFLGTRQGYDGEQLKKILDRSLRPTGEYPAGYHRGRNYPLGIAGLWNGGYYRTGAGEKRHPAVPGAFSIAGLIRASVGAAVVAMTMAAGIMAATPGAAESRRTRCIWRQWSVQSTVVQRHSAMSMILGFSGW